jgi:hypothetical protein
VSGLVKYISAIKNAVKGFFPNAEVYSSPTGPMSEPGLATGQYASMEFKKLNNRDLQVREWILGSCATKDGSHMLFMR